MKLKTLTCPNCSQTNNFLAEVCDQCGINFSKYFEELEKAEELRRHIEEQERLESQRRQEAEDRRREEKEAEALRRKEEEKQKAEADRLKKEEEERRLKEEERQKAEADRLKKEEEERRLREEERQKAEADRLKKEEEERRLREEERQRADADRLEQEEEERRFREEEAGTLGRREEDVQQDEAAETFPPTPASVFWSDDDQEASLASHHLLRDANDLPRVLSRYVGATIGLSFGNARTIKAVRLITVRKDHFQVLFISRKLTAIFPFHSLDLVAESPDGISAESPDISPVFPAVLQVTKPFFT